MPAAEIATIDHTTLAQRAAAGTIVGADVIGRPGGWSIVVMDAHTSRALVGSRGSVRLFKRFEAVVDCLRLIGLDRFQVDARGFALNNSSSRRASEPAGEETEHDRWFRSEVQKTLADIDGGGARLLSDGEHRARWRQRLADMLTRSRHNA